jgi:hypothetical protein
MRERYSREVFEALYQAIAQKLLTETPPIKILKDGGKQDTSALGINWRGPVLDAGQHHAAAVIHAASVAAGVIDGNANLNFGKFLYSKYNQLSDPDNNKKNIVIQYEEYSMGLVRYLGYDTPNDFKAAVISAKQAVDEAQMPAPKSPPPPSVNEGSYTHYIGAFYSFRSYRVNKFVLAIQYQDLPAQSMPSWQWGFHSTERLQIPEIIPERINSVRFDGAAEVRGRHLYINLSAPATADRSGMEMHLIGICDEVGGAGLKSQEAIPCTLQTVSLDGYPVSVESCLVRCTESEARRVMDDPHTYFDTRLNAGVLTKKPALEKALHLYLMLQRRNFRVKLKPNASDLEHLEYRKNLVSKYTERLSGEFRIWNFGLERSVVVQSKLQISIDTPYRALFYPYLSDAVKSKNPGLDEQLAVLVISNEIRRDQLCFSTFVKRGLTLVNHAIFDIRNLNDTAWVEGMFMTTGYDEKGIIGGYSVMCRVKPDEECEPKRMSREESQRYADELGLSDMLDGLRKLWKRKLWKQKSNTLFGCYGIALHPQEGGLLLVRRNEGPYQGLYDLPGGKLEHGETPEAGLRRLVASDTGVVLNTCTLWCNDTVSTIWERSAKMVENLYHIGALYQIEPSAVQPGQLLPQASWVQPGQYQQDAFSPFARKALEQFCPTS